jgi:HEAT repeat protein
LHKGENQVETEDQSLPDYVYQAFGLVYYGGDFQAEIESFAQRWRGLDANAFERAVREGVGEEKIIAIFALGSLNPPGVQEMLVPLLQSPVRLERWASAIALGRLYDERALPVLHTILQYEALLPVMEDLTDESMCYINYREIIVSLLANWGDQSSIPILHAALKAAWGWELQLLANPPYYAQFDLIPFWQAYQYRLAYALGHLGVFGALTDIPFSDSRRRILMIYMALGHLQVEQDDIFTKMMLDKNLQEEVAKALERLFGLSEAEQHVCLVHFGDDYFREGALEGHPSPPEETWEEWEED